MFIIDIVVEIMLRKMRRNLNVVGRLAGRICIVIEELGNQLDKIEERGYVRLLLMETNARATIFIITIIATFNIQTSLVTVMVRGTIYAVITTTSKIECIVF